MLLSRPRQSLPRGTPEIKVLLIGDGGVDKTTLIKSLSAGEMQTQHIGQINTDIHSVLLHTNIGLMKFNVWDGVGKKKLREEYYSQGQCAIVLFDVTVSDTFKNVPNWHSDLTGACPNIPVALMGIKDLSADRKVKAKQITFPRKKKTKYFAISTATTYDFEKIFMWLARELTGENDLHLVEPPVSLLPPEAVLNDAIKAQHKAEIQQATKVPLPEGDGDGDDV